MEYLILAAVLASYIAIMGELHSIKRLLELLVAPPISGPTPVAADKKACRADHAKLQAMRLAPKYCPECGERLSCR